MKKVAITGANGFIGSRLTERLLTENYKIKVLSRNGKSIFPGVEVIKGDLSDSLGMGNFLQEADILIHLAAVQPSANTEQLFTVNVNGTSNLVMSALQYGLTQIIYLSTSAIYGESQNNIYTEDCNPRPSTEYGLTKYMGEINVRYWATKTGNISTILRPFNVYGPGNKKGVIYNFYKSEKETGKVNIFGDGTQKRDYLYVDDVVSAIVRSIEVKCDGVINLGTGNQLSLIEVVKAFENVTGKELPIEFKTTEDDKVHDTLYDVSKAKSVLGWQASVDFEEGLRKTIDWLNSNS